MNFFLLFILFRKTAAYIYIYIYIYIYLKIYLEVKERALIISLLSELNSVLLGAKS
jgi:hypothetical protein